MEAVTERLRKMLDKTKAENADLQGKLSALKTQLGDANKAKEDLAKATTKVDTLEAVQRSLSDSRSKLEDERDQLKVALGKAERDGKPLRDELAALKALLAEKDKATESQQSEIEFLAADFDYKLISERKRLEGKIASLSRLLHASRLPRWIFASDVDRDTAVNLLDFSKLDVVVVDTRKWGQAGADQVKHNLADVLAERNALTPGFDAEQGTLAQLEEPLLTWFAQPATAALLVVPPKSPEADPQAWSEALSALTSALARTLSAECHFALVIEDASIKQVADRDVFGNGVAADAPFLVAPLEPKVAAERVRHDSL